MKSTLDKPNCLLIASTKLHLFSAIIVAKQFPEYSYHLFYIDQSSPEDVYFKAVEAWGDNPFESQTLWVMDKRSLVSKVGSKRQAIKEIFTQTMRLKPQKIIVGNDRKNEISALLHKLDGKYQGIEIGYMDDGIHSYVLEQSGLFKYTVLDSILKSLIYGNKISTPKLIGVRDDIRELYLYRPELRHSYLQKKQAYELDTEFLQTASFNRLVVDIAKRLGVSLEEELKGVENIIFLPHPKAIQDGYTEKLGNLDKTVAIKLHPRDHQHRQYFEAKGIKVLDNELVAELIVLGLQRNIKIFGFASTALLMAVWLRPTFDVYSLKFDQQALSELEQLMQQNGIQVLPIDELSDFPL